MNLTGFKCFFQTCICFLILLPPTLARATPLDDYVKQRDSNYEFKLQKTLETPNETTFILQLVSQKWRKESEVSRPVWHHRLTIVRHKKVEFDSALLYVGKGLYEKDSPAEVDQRLTAIAVPTRSIVSEIRNVPNQPLIYFDDPDNKERIEDDLLAYSWAQAMKTNEPTWSLRFPMVTSVVRAMDATQAFMQTPTGGPRQIKSFILAGESKRGWAVWLSVALDGRVVAIIPMVIGVLHVKQFLQHHFAAYGFWAQSLKVYVNHRNIEKLESQEFEKLLQWEDPYFCQERIQVPQSLIHPTGDQFFLPDYSPAYFRELKGPSYLHFLPNADHSMRDSDAFQMMEVFYSFLLHKVPLPEFSWIKKPTGSIEVQVNPRVPPESIVLWSATNPKARFSFRDHGQRLSFCSYGRF